MRSKSISVAISATLAVLLLGATSASAATEAGNHCVGNSSASSITIISLANGGGNPLPATIPVNGVISRWTFSVEPIPPGVLSQTLKIFRATGTPKQFQVVGESASAPISTGLNTFSTRIPVHAGDFIGSSGTVPGEQLTVFCETTDAGDRVAAVPGNSSLNSFATTGEEASELQNPITVSIEADADGDGFGDETQDQCPQSAATQAACPIVKLSGSATSAKKSVTIALTGTTTAMATVNGKVSLGKGKKAKLKGGSKIVSPGKLTKFKLKFPAKLIERLKELAPSKKLTLKVTATAPNVAAVPTKKTIRVKLKGQAPAG